MKVYTQPMVRGKVDDLVFCVCGTMYYARRYVKPRITEHNVALGNKVRIAMRLYKELSEVAMARLQQHTDTLNKQEPYRNGKGITRSSAWLQLFFRFMEQHPEISWETVSMQDLEQEGDIIIPMLGKSNDLKNPPLRAVGNGRWRSPKRQKKRKNGAGISYSISC